jgi:hypothetical protein
VPDATGQRATQALPDRCGTAADALVVTARTGAGYRIQKWLLDRACRCAAGRPVTPPDQVLLCVEHLVAVA